MNAHLGFVLFLLMAMMSPSGALAQLPGTLDPLDVNVTGLDVLATATQPDGKIILVGEFSAVHGVARNGIARLNADGSLDTGFAPQANNSVYCVALQLDGKILIGGLFTALQPNGGAVISRNYFARLLADGSVDMAFDPNPNATVFCIMVQPDAKIVLGGAFSALRPNGSLTTYPRGCVARIEADGTMDYLFNPYADDHVFSMALQPDGQILLAGNFMSLQPQQLGTPVARQRIARIDLFGAVDPGFDPKANGSVRAIAMQPDGKILIGGDFLNLQPNGSPFAIQRTRLARLNADGTIEMGVEAQPNGTVYSIALQANGMVILGGDFGSLEFSPSIGTATRNKIARIEANGEPDEGFDPNASGAVYGIALQPDGRVLLSGAFTYFQPNHAAEATYRYHLARLHNDAATQTLSVPDATQATWTRGGATPELFQVTFDKSTDGGVNWTPLGAGTRVGTTSDWQITGLALSGSGQLRARGRTDGGYYNGSSGLVQSTVSFNFSPVDADGDGLLDVWELAHWPSITTQNALDDSDHDGHVELMELAFDLDPTRSDPGGLPALTLEGGFLTLTITKQPGVTYQIQSAGSLLPAAFSHTSTIVITDDATTLKARDQVNISAHGRRFMRVQVTAAP